jgi:molybdate transport system substrate-binding protein
MSESLKVQRLALSGKLIVRLSRKPFASLLALNNTGCSLTTICLDAFKLRRRKRYRFFHFLRSSMKSFLLKLSAFAFIGGVAVAATAITTITTVHAAELHVMSSGGFTAAYKILGPKFAAASGNTLNTTLGPSMGKAPEAIPNRLARGEPADVVIMVGYALDDLIKQGKVIPGSRVELADSAIGMVVRAGAAKPDIGTVAALKDTLLHAKSIAYSDSASGVYIQNELFKRLGIEDQIRPKASMVPKIPVASVVASGDYELGFQQVSELLPIPGVTFVGKIPESVQSITRYAAGIPVGAQHPAEAKALLEYLASPEAAPVVTQTGLDPVPVTPHYSRYVQPGLLMYRLNPDH